MKQKIAVIFFVIMCLLFFFGFSVTYGSDRIVMELNHRATEVGSSLDQVEHFSGSADFVKFLSSECDNSGSCFTSNLIAVANNWELMSPQARRLIMPLNSCCSDFLPAEEHVVVPGVLRVGKDFPDGLRVFLGKYLPLLDNIFPAPSQSELLLVFEHRGDGFPSFISPLPEKRGDNTVYSGFVNLDDYSNQSVLHQIIHMRQLEYDKSAVSWQYEAHALWLMNMILGNDKLPASSVESNSDELKKTFFNHSCFRVADPAWFFFLYELSGKNCDLINSLWAVGDNENSLSWQERMNSVLSNDADMSLNEAYSLFAQWNLLRGKYASSLNPYGADWKEIEPADEYSMFSARGNDSGFPPEQYGSCYIRFVNDDFSTGGFNFKFEGNSIVDWSVSLLVISRQGGSDFVPVDVVDGKGSIYLPAVRTGEVFMVISNLSDESYSYFNFSVDYDKSYPFVLVGSELEKNGNRLELSWRTAGEKGVVGWNILRASPSSGETVKINSDLIPGPHTMTGNMNYLYLTGLPDDDCFFLLQAVTDSGMTSELLLGKYVPSRPRDFRVVPRF